MPPKIDFAPSQRDAAAAFTSSQCIANATPAAINRPIPVINSPIGFIVMVKLSTDCAAFTAVATVWYAFHSAIIFVSTLNATNAPTTPLRTGINQFALSFAH